MTDICAKARRCEYIMPRAKMTKEGYDACNAAIRQCPKKVDPITRDIKLMNLIEEKPVKPIGQMDEKVACSTARSCMVMARKYTPELA